MEPWSLLVLVLMLTTHWIKTVQSRDFTLKDVVLLHPSTTPHPHSFKCFTCEDAEDNYLCNRWAPDIFCPKHSRFCSTLHMMDLQGVSVSVTKRCASQDDCSFTGCSILTGSDYQVCSSCCEGNICNMLVPTNHSSAVFSSVSPLSSSHHVRLHPGPLPFITLLIITAAHA
ncbi:ly6/PLAUR domain-containing protein 6-like [Gouania willdenowi]|uniref:Ly6/PLAUR domain-containing protein 6-like n=1 Tax=Gouania willdenowi TaxID=441366 RepID=A0A8C5G395_GOUWI|nr:ly6/PLAUR domain-containing protein 6-like [Gouania willdenowi]